MSLKWRKRILTVFVWGALLPSGSSLARTSLAYVGLVSQSFGRGLSLGWQACARKEILAQVEASYFSIDNAAVKVANTNEMNFSSTHNWRLSGGGQYEFFSQDFITAYAGLGMAYLSADKGLLRSETLGGYIQLGARWLNSDKKKGFYCEQRIYEGLAAAKEIQNHPNLFSAANLIFGLLYAL